MAVVVISETDDTGIVVTSPVTTVALPSIVAVQFSKNLADANGLTQSIVCGFTPRMVLFTAGVTGTGGPVYLGFAFNTLGVNNPSSALNLQTGLDLTGVGAGQFYQPTLCLVCRDSENTGIFQYASLQSWDPTGFTLSWTKSGSPIQTATILAACFR